MLSEGENLQEDTVRKLTDSMTFKDSEDMYEKDPIILRIDDGVIEWIVTDLKEAMERTQKFKLVEIEQEEGDEIYDSEEEIEIIVEDKMWKLGEIRIGLRQLIVNPKEKLIREIMKFGIKEKIETGILLTCDFIRYYIFLKGRFDKSEEIKEWMDSSTIICNRCSKQKLDYMISKENGRCEECNQEIREDEQDDEESGEKSDNEESEDNTDDSKKTGEILNPDEIWDENIENFNEDEFEDKIENVINRGDIDLSQNSDTNSLLNIKNSDNESELSDYNLQDLFQEDILNMATENQIKRLIENALGYPVNTLNAAVGAGASLIERIENAGNEAGGVISVPLFYGKEDEDVNDWVRQFEVAFTAVGKAAGANGTRQAAYAAAHLRGQQHNEIAVREEGVKDEFIRKAIGTPVSTSIDIKRDNNRQNMFAKPLNENYEDELVKAFEEKARISKLEGLVSNIERRLNNDNRNRY
ncbi:hypothetical protein GLOIN_2v1804155 [Rhizophagus irregularis DAOM 181602=DAOM 197198]|nr:hypothetical protein GLOIN_2v1804155 [Rhizophagus irregularis DAOM 181602=DAOM 197198]